MTPFENYLLLIGYKRYRSVYDGKRFNYVESNSGYSFTSVDPGGLDYRYIKDGHEIIFGLNERDKPPTLICGKVAKSDDAMNRILKSNTPEQVYKLIIQ